MKHSMPMLALAGLLLAGAALPASAQESPSHVVDRGELERVTAEADRSDDVRRQAIRSVLERDEVRSVAEEHGLDLTRAKDAVATLDGNGLQRVAAQAERVDEALAGGDTTIVIGTTTLIIALLVLIIILVS